MDYEMDLTKVKTDTRNDPVPTGLYLVKIMEIEAMKTKKEIDFIRIGVEIIEGDFKKRKLEDRLFFGEPSFWVWTQLFQSCDVKITDLKGEPQDIAKTLTGSFLGKILQVRAVMKTSTQFGTRTEIKARIKTDNKPQPETPF